MYNLLQYLGRAVCHQIITRSFIIGEPLPVCARCAGIFAGVLISHLYLALFPGKSKVMPLLSVSIGLVVLLLPLAFDGVTSYLAFRETNNLIRLFTGFLLGIALPLLYMPLAAEDPRPIAGQSLNWCDLALIVTMAVFVAGGMYLAMPANWWLWSTIIIVGHFLLYFNIIRLILSRLGWCWYLALPAYGLFVLALNLVRDFAGV